MLGNIQSMLLVGWRLCKLYESGKMTPGHASPGSFSFSNYANACFELSEGLITSSLRFFLRWLSLLVGLELQDGPRGGGLPRPGAARWERDFGRFPSGRGNKQRPTEICCSWTVWLAVDTLFEVVYTSSTIFVGHL
jgi:hypothetical protein